MPYPEKGEDEKKFLRRCIPETINEGYKNKQSVAICYSKYRSHGTEAKSPKPEKKKLSNNKKMKLLLLHY